jgi:hypothetical protein
MLGRTAFAVVIALTRVTACDTSHAPDVDAGSRAAETGPADARQLQVYTHCGVWSVVVDGQLWLADPPLHDGSHNPPNGWGENTTDGTWRQTAPDRAVFHATTGEAARFARAPAGRTDPNTGCE